MINLNKKQVGSLLKVMSKDEMRPILMSAYIDEWDDDLVMVATNGYVLSVLYLDDDAKPLVGHMIRREAFERWYKLATGKDRLTTQALVRLSSEDYANHNGYAEGEYPDWKKIIPNGVPERQPEMIFDADFAKVLQDLEDAEGMKWELTGRLSPMISITKKGTYLLMPRKV